MTDREHAEGAVQRTVDELGRLDILVNNAGVMLLGPAADAPVEEWERMVERERARAALLREGCAPAPARGGRVRRAASRTW